MKRILKSSIIILLAFLLTLSCFGCKNSDEPTYALESSNESSTEGISETSKEDVTETSATTTAADSSVESSEETSSTATEEETEQGPSLEAIQALCRHDYVETPISQEESRFTCSKCQKTYIKHKTLEEIQASCNHDYKETPLGNDISQFTCALCQKSYKKNTSVKDYTNGLKILAIGNSFTVDSMEYLWDICKSGGIKNVTLGNLYIGGCQLDKHYTNMSQNLSEYKYYKNTTGKWNSTDKVSILTAMNDEEWDIVVIHQSSAVSGVPSSFSKLEKIIEYINKNEPNAKIYWNMTWAYQSDSAHASFPTYDKDQFTMYNAIQTTLQAKIVPQSAISGIIPTGTAIQNLRASYVGDIVTRDGYHLSYNYGRYTAALTWFSYITGFSPDSVSYTPPKHSTVLNRNLSAIREAVANAIETPYSVTPSRVKNPSFTTPATDAQKLLSLGLNPNDYEQINWVREASAYYNSTARITIYNKTTSGVTNLDNFIASILFTKDTLPVGSVIIVDEGYSYRPEGWKNRSYVASSSARPKIVSTQAVKVTEDWWGDYTIRAFNLSATEAKAITLSDAAHLRIYVPKNS